MRHIIRQYLSTILCLFILFPVFGTYLFAYLHGDYLAEALSVFCIFILSGFLVCRSKISYDSSRTTIFILAISGAYLFSIALARMIFEGAGLSGYIYLLFSGLTYIFFVVSTVPVFRIPVSDRELVAFAIVLLGCFSAIFGVAQKFSDLPIFPPIDISRARGLSRSTLNFSVLLYIALNFYLLVFRRYSYILLGILYLGIFASLGRAYILGSLVLTVIVFKTRAQRIFIILIFFVIAMLIYGGNFSEIIEHYELNRVFDPESIEDADRDRFNSYKRIFDELSFLGFGFSSVGPAAGRFLPYEHGFESFLLNLLFQCGWMAVVFVYVFLKNFKKLKIDFDAKVLLLGWAPPLVLSQALENPTALLLFILWLWFFRLRWDS